MRLRGATMAEPASDSAEFHQLVRQIEALLKGKNERLVAQIGLAICASAIRASIPSRDQTKMESAIREMTAMLEVACDYGKPVTLQ